MIRDMEPVPLETIEPPDMNIPATPSTAEMASMIKHNRTSNFSDLLKLPNLLESANAIICSKAQFIFS